MPTIDLRIPIKITVPDAAGVEQTYELHEGLNDVPREVVEHWYVSKFTRPMPSIPRMPRPSVARPATLPPAAIETMAEAVKPPAAQPEADT